jgi:hypothetical protein
MTTAMDAPRPWRARSKKWEAISAFIQIIEFQTSRIDEFDALLDQWLTPAKDWRTAARSVRTKDPDRPDTYVQIVEFPSEEKTLEIRTGPKRRRVPRASASPV